VPLSVVPHAANEVIINKVVNTLPILFLKFISKTPLVFLLPALKMTINNGKSYWVDEILFLLRLKLCFILS
jgi:hypothetical protein